MEVAGYVAAAPSSAPSLSRSSEGRRASSSALAARRDQRASVRSEQAANAQAPKGEVRAQNTPGPLPAPFLTYLTRVLHEQRAFRLDQLAGLDAAGLQSSDPVRREVDATLRAAARLVLAEIDAALLRIERGSFGRCGRCGEVMSVQRLRALPMSTWCGSCQRLRELAVLEPVPDARKRPQDGPTGERASS